MEATTKLQFTLTSPGVDPTPTPTPTPSDPTYTTIVGSPNTGGENNAAGDNISGTVFTSLFIIIGIAALMVFLARYLKKNRHLSFAERGSFRISSRPRVYATVALTLAVAFLGGITITNIYSNAERNTEAASQKLLKVTANPNIVFDVDRGETSVKSDTIKVENNGARYDLYAYTNNNKFALETDSSEFLSPVNANVTATVADLVATETNQWGMSLQTGSIDIAGKVWGAAPTTETIIDANASSGSKTVNYGVNLGEDLSDGTYSTTVTYKAIAKNYQVTTIRGYVNRTGTLTNYWFDDGVTVYIRPNCGSASFLYWTSDDIDVSIISGPSEGDLYQFTMPAKDVTITAHCDAEPTEPDWIIKYNANAPTGKTATGTMADTLVSGTTAKLRKNAFAITGYIFKGWACNKNATSADFTDEQDGITQTGLESKGCPKTPGGDDTEDPDSYTIYALWKIDTSTITYVQEVTPEMCDEMALFEVKTLPDRRDNKNYSFTKYADGRCWMTQDLDYRPSGSIALTAADTDISSDRPVSFGTSGSVDGLYKTQSSYSTLYNYNAATAGYWKTWSSKSVNKVVPDSLCPASWKIPDASHGPADPSYGTNAGELYRLWNYNIGKNNGYGATATKSWKRDFMFGTTVSTTGGKSVTAPHFTYNGSWDFSGGAWADGGGSADKGKPGNYASYFLNTTTTKSESDSTVWPAAFNPHSPASGESDTADINVTNPAHGSAVRCVLRTASERADRNKSTATGDYTELSASEQARVNQDH